MHQDRMPPSRRAQKIAWRMILALAAVPMGAIAQAGDVTVIGSLWRSTPPSEFDDADRPLPPTEYPIGPPAQPKPPLLEYKDRPVESCVYTRVDYFRWSMPADGYNEAMKSGALNTLGYARRIGAERFRFEFFGGNLRFSDTAYYSLGKMIFSERESGDVCHYGGRSEIEHVWNLHMDEGPPLTLFAGLGTRIWRDDYTNAVTDSGLAMPDYHDVWWTLYPYAGFERVWELHNGSEVFLTGRLGSTVITYMHSAVPNEPAFYPNPGITAQAECGWRRGWFSMSAYFETFGWAQSQTEHVHYDHPMSMVSLPRAQLYTTGLKLGVSY